MWIRWIRIRIRIRIRNTVKNSMSKQSPLKICEFFAHVCVVNADCIQCTLSLSLRMLSYFGIVTVFEKYTQLKLSHRGNILYTT
jgi:hypothetical protein